MSLLPVHHLSDVVGVIPTTTVFSRLQPPLPHHVGLVVAYSKVLVELAKLRKALSLCCLPITIVGSLPYPINVPVSGVVVSPPVALYVGYSWLAYRIEYEGNIGCGREYSVGVGSGRIALGGSRGARQDLAEASPRQQVSRLYPKPSRPRR